jgi:hypothetical protein
MENNFKGDQTGGATSPDEKARALKQSQEILEGGRLAIIVALD